MTPEQDLVQKLADFEQMIVCESPEIPMAISRIHKQLKESPEMLHMLNDDQINIIIRGLEVQTGIYLSGLGEKEKKATKRAQEKKLGDLEI